MSSTVQSTYTDDSFQSIYPGRSQKVSFSAMSASVAPNRTSSKTTIVRLSATENCWVRLSDGEVAAANDGSSFFLPAMTEYIGCKPNQQISVIGDTASGDLHITEALP